MNLKVMPDLADYAIESAEWTRTDIAPDEDPSIEPFRGEVGDFLLTVVGRRGLDEADGVLSIISSTGVGHVIIRLTEALALKALRLAREKASQP
jgi:hypothetical protein